MHIVLINLEDRVIDIDAKKFTVSSVLDIAEKWAKLSDEQWILSFRTEAYLYKGTDKFRQKFETLSPKTKYNIYMRIFQAQRPDKIIRFLDRYKYSYMLFPFLEDMHEVSQNKKRGKNLFDHSLRALCFAGGLTTDPYIRMGAFFHDIGKVVAIKNHEKIGARMTREILLDFGFMEGEIDYVCKLVLYHLLPHNFQRNRMWSDKSIYKYMQTVGGNGLALDLCTVAIADKMASQGENTKYVEPYHRLMKEIRRLRT